MYIHTYICRKRERERERKKERERERDRENYMDLLLMIPVGAKALVQEECHLRPQRPLKGFLLHLPCWDLARIWCTTKVSWLICSLRTLNIQSTFKMRSWGSETLVFKVFKAQKLLNMRSLG